MKRKWLAIGIILLFVGVTIAPAIAQNAEESQTSRGSWLYVGGSGPGNYTRIQDAIDNASDGDTVFVYDDSSPYNENVRVNKSITLLGANRETTIIDANGSGCPIYLGASFVCISGFTLQNSGGGNDNAGVYVNYYWPPQDCNNNTITDNKIINNTFGIHLAYTSNNSVNNNTITLNRRDGIFCENSDLSRIENNLIMKNDKASMSGDAGIRIKESYSITITKNHIDGNAESIHMYRASSCNILENTLCNNREEGIVLGGSYNNLIYSNNFINNTKDAYFVYSLRNAPIIANRFVNNYWDSYIGIGPKIIVGDYYPLILMLLVTILIGGYPGEFSIKWLNFDWHPAKEPYDIPGMS